MDPSAVALLTVFLTAVLAPFAAAWMKNRGESQQREQEAAIRRAERAEDKEALQETAVKAQEVADQAKTAARLLVESNAKAAGAASVLADKVDRVSEISTVIHTLVNSKLTITTQKLRDATAASLALARKYEPDGVVAITRLKAQLDELDAELSERAASPPP